MPPLTCHEGRGVGSQTRLSWSWKGLERFFCLLRNIDWAVSRFVITDAAAVSTLVQVPECTRTGDSLGHVLQVELLN